MIDELEKLEKGVVMYDAYLQKKVLVIAPLLCILADNVRASELVNHMGSAANKYCRICQVSNHPLQDIVKPTVHNTFCSEYQTGKPPQNRRQKAQISG